MVRIPVVMLLAFGAWAGTSSEKTTTNTPAASKVSVTANSATASPFLEGIELYQAGKFEQAEPRLREAGKSAGALSLYQSYFLADTLMQLGKTEEAAPLLKGILIQKPPYEVKNRTLFLLSQIAVGKAQWREARFRLQPLARKWKSSVDYPQVLHRLMRAELKLRNHFQACNWARKLYTRYPVHPLVSSWTSDLQQVNIDGQKIGCQIRMSDVQERVKHLEWSGESDRARKEIEELRTRVSEHEQASVDQLMARFLVTEGLVEDALALLIRVYPEQKSDYNYLALLAVAAARAGEFQTAVGAYEKAYALTPHSRKGREALFQAAFLSYQFQDYDGAVKKFTELVDMHPRSGLARDAEWHLAWLQYLRNDFEGSYKRMSEARARGLRSRKFRGSTSDQRLQYWMAMSQFRLNHLADAKTAFENLVHEQPYGYYALAAQARLAQIPKDASLARTTSALSAAPAKTAATAPAAAPGAKVAAEEEDDDESEDELSRGDVQDQQLEVEEKEAGSEMEPLDSSDFKEPALKAHLQAARELTALNLTDLARAELWEVERRTANPVYLKLLVTAYETIGSYYRSSNISENNFMQERVKLGLDGAKSLWSSSYPQAFKKFVQKGTSVQQIPDEWVWGIMRAESHYKTDVISPVGAQGLMQLMPFTARNLARLGNVTGFRVEDLMDPATNIFLGAQYLARLGKQFHRNLSLMAAAYNAGPHRVQGWLVSFGHLETDEFIEHIPFVETRNYVKRVLFNNYAYRMIYSKDASPFKFIAEPLGVAIPTKIPTHESWEAI